MWVARDKDGYLCLYTVKPVRDVVLDNWVYPEGDEYFNCDYIELDDEKFPNLKWEDEPIEVELILSDYRKELEKILDKYEEANDKSYLDNIENGIQKVDFKLPNNHTGNCMDSHGNHYIKNSPDTSKESFRY